MILVALLAPVLGLYADTILAIGAIGQTATGLYPAQLLDVAATHAGVPNPTSAGVGDLLTYTLSS